MIKSSGIPQLAAHLNGLVQDIAEKLKVSVPAAKRHAEQGCWRSLNRRSLPSGSRSLACSSHM